ncbi:MAG TPA: MFS transporter [Planctomycetaceae bacterium]|nr:MFS transporter [Planctomycetaceae bacterium]
MSQERPVLSSLQSRPAPSYKWWVVGMLWFICFFNYADRMAINAVAKVLQDDYHFTDEDLGWIISAFMFVYALSAPFAGQIGDRYRRKSLILGGLAVWSVVTGATGFCRRWIEFVIVRATEGLGETFYFPATMSLIADYHAKPTRSRAMGLHQTSVYAGTIGGTALAGYLASEYGWQAPFKVFGIAGIVLAIVLFIFLREPARNEAERMEAQTLDDTPSPPAIPLAQFMRELVYTPSALILIAAFFGANSVAFVFLSWMPKYLGDQFHMNLGMAGFSATFYLRIASIVGSIFGGWLADRARMFLPGGRILSQALGALLGIPLIYLCGRQVEATPLLIYLTCFGLAEGIYDANIWASMYDVIHPSRRGTMLGLANMIGWLGAGVATVGTGMAMTRLHMTYGQVLSVTAIIYAVVTVLLIVAGLVFAPRDIRRAQEGIAPAN